MKIIILEERSAECGEKNHKDQIVNSTTLTLMDKKYLQDDVYTDRSVINNGKILFSGIPKLIYTNPNPMRNDYLPKVGELHYKESYP